jgi:hypothetical protein
MSQTDRSGVALSAADDEFHRPDQDPWYLETFWFSYHVPERKLEGYIYTKFYPNQRIYGGGALVWDDSAYLPWEVPYYDLQWHLPWPDGLKTLRECSLPNGTKLRCLEPLKKYHVVYQSEEHEVDIVWDAVLPAFSQPRGDVPYLFAGHIDHPGRATGTIRLHGETIAVDCIAQRDRSWGPRTENRQLRMGYCHAVSSAKNGFLVITSPTPAGDPILSGYRMKDGELGHFVSGERSLEREENGNPTRSILRGIDDQGRPFEAVGTVLSRIAFPSFSGIFHVISLTRWEWDGVVGYGEDQDLFHPARWRDFIREHRASRARKGRR